ncbi:MAG TPA: hypothetical protein VM327_07975 [Candidatus Thermoplasmatota archaeon]|nr:hypothetical protein [Candidatus Thermoplasmatota archaeon]
MLRRLLMAAVLVSCAFAGCATSDEPASDREGSIGAVGQPGYSYTGPGHFFAGPALYEDPQNTPHPAYNWPTVAHPAVGADVPKWWRPNHGTDLPVAVTGLEFAAQSPGVPAGAGIALFGSIAVVPGFGQPTSFVDISEPTSPKLLSQVEPTVQEGEHQGEGLSHRGATIIAYPTGRLVTVISTDSLLDVWDITDPTAPVQLPQVTDLPNSHKVGVVPGTPFVYNAGSSGGAANGLAGPEAQTGKGVGKTEIFDFSDPEHVVKVQDWQNGYACHHIYFWNNVTEGKYRSTCAGIEYTQIIDTTDPAHPEVIVSVPYGLGDPTLPSQSAFIAAFSHYAGLSRDGKVLLVGDENGGGIGPIGCVARADTPMGSVSSPVGAVWFYDVSHETQPRYLSHVSASQLDRAANGGSSGPLASCTAHHGRLVPVDDGDLLAMSFYGAGVLLIDFTNVRSEGAHLPTVVAQYAGEGCNVWETWYYNGYLYTGDMGRGMDVIDLV